MKFELLNTNYDLSLIDRLLEIRNIKDKEKFLNPTWKNSWYDPFLLSDMQKSIDRIISAIKNNERIIVFGDYDVDGVTSTYVVFYFLYKILNYKNVSIRLPSRQDGYWIRGFHLDELKQKNVSLIITVDNWITAVEEVSYAKSLGMDLIITDHHTPLEVLPDAYSIINPKLWNYPFKDLAWVGVAFKLISALANRLNLSKLSKEKLINYFLPIVAIWTVADCVPLIDENRFLVKKWLEIINNSKKRPPNIDNLISYLKLKEVDSYHIWFVIGPRLNASGRIHKPDNSFQVLFQHSKSVQEKYLDLLEEMNKQRQNTQSDILKEIEEKIDLNENILLAVGDFHEWVIWIVAGRLSEKYNKPAIVLSVQKDKNQAVGSCRSPLYFSIIELLNKIWEEGILERYWGHAQAGGLTINLDNLDKFKQLLKKYWEDILPDNLEKILFVDTELLKQDFLSEDIQNLDLLSPFWEQNPKPVFLIKDVKVVKVDVVGKQNNHIKILAEKDWIQFNILKWSGLSLLEKLKSSDKLSVIVNWEKDSFNGGFYFKLIDFI